VGLTWDGVGAAARYDVFRSSNNSTYAPIGSSLTPQYSDSGLLPDTTYLYQVRAVNGAGEYGPASNVDVATTIVFTDSAIVAGSTIVRAVHMTELRTAVGAMVAAAGMPPLSAILIQPGTVIEASHLTELRARLNMARSAFGVPPVFYSDPGLGSGTLIRAAHILELRAGVK
jgi:hypothetical protein